MAFWTELTRRASYLARRTRFQAEMDDEIRFHLECRADELEQGGLTRPEALLAAQREFGSRRRAAEESHSAWQFLWWEDFLSDLRYAARALKRNPAFTLTAVLCLALGIGANITMFSISTSFLFSTPSSSDPATLLGVRIGGNSHADMADYRFFRDAGIFQGLAGINVDTEVNWRHGAENSRLYAARVTSNFFNVIGVPVALGRGIAPGETDTVVIGAHFRNQRLAAVGDVLGQSLILDGRAYTIVGVLPADHRTLIGFGLAPDLYLPVIHDDDMVQLYGRLAGGATLPATREQFRSAARERDRIDPQKDWKRSEEITVAALNPLDLLGSQASGAMLAFFTMLMIVVGLVLLIACANVASLLLARASSRAQELAIRLSLGASRMRLVRHLMAESLVIAILGATAGFVLNLGCAGWLSRMRLPLPVPIQLVIRPDWRLLAYSAAVTLVSTLACGLLPALGAVRKNVNVVLKRQERQIGTVWNLRGVLVTGQLAVSIVLLATGLLFVRNLLSATSMSPGFDVRRTLWSYMRLVPESYKDHAKAKSLIDAALERLRALPGVESASIARAVPLNDSTTMGRQMTTDIDARPVHVQYLYNAVGPDYFRTMGIPILRGREFTSRDAAGAQGAVVVNEAFARRYFGNIDPVGHVVRFKQSKPNTIVGLAKNSKYFTIGEDEKVALYEPYPDSKAPTNLHFLLRTPGDPALLENAVNAALGGLDRTAATETKPMSRALGLALLASRVGAAILGATGLLALTLAAIGLYGVLLYSVSRRTREIGLRVALGATPRQVLRIVFRHSFALVALGTGVGLGLALLVTRPLTMFLVPGLSPADPLAFAVAIGALSVVAVAATLDPALRALRVDPNVALKYE